MLIARLDDRTEIVDIIDASLSDRVVFLRLQAAPATDDDQRLELHATFLEEPLVLRAQPVGDGVDGLFPLLVRPTHSRQEKRLRAILVRETAEQSRRDLGRIPTESSLQAPGASPRPDDAPVELVFGRRTGAPPPTPRDEPELPALRSAEVPDLTRRGAPHPAGSTPPDESPPPPPQLTELVQEHPVDPEPVERVPTEPLESALAGILEEDPSILKGRSIGGGKYRIETVLGTGAMGTVYRARQIALDRAVAVKVLNPSLQADSMFAARFHREALSASKLDHPNVMRVLDFGQEQQDFLYIVMEFLDGHALQRIIEAARPMPVARMVNIMSQVCSALMAAHDLGIVHRDIKPDNIMVLAGRDDDGEAVDLVKVCDFGLAKMSDVRSEPQDIGPKLTAVGSIWGTPTYMSPEQGRGLPIDARSDLYSCGVMLYEIVTGRVPFDADTPMDMVNKQISEDPVSPGQIVPDLDPRLEALILKAMAKNPARRHQSARELRAELRALLESAPDPGRPGSRLSMPMSTPTPVPPGRILTPKDQLPAVSVPPDPRRYATPHPPRAVAAGVEPMAARDALGGDGEDPELPALGERATGFTEFFVALTAAVARSSYYERGHPEFNRALEALIRTAPTPLERRREVSFSRRVSEGSVQLFVQDGTGASSPLRKAVTTAAWDTYGSRLTDVFVRRGLVVLTLRERITEDELSDMMGLLAGPEISTDELRAQFLSCGLRHVSVLFQSELLGRDRKLPWEVDLCISRLARDFTALPLLRGIDQAGMRELRTQLVADVLRGLRGPMPVKLLLENSDLIAVAVRHVRDLADLDMSALVVLALGNRQAVRVVGLMLEELEREAALREAGQEEDATAAQARRRVVALFGERFVRDRSVEGDEVIRMMLNRSILSFPDLPVDIQIWIHGEQLATSLVQDGPQVLRALDSVDDLDRFARTIDRLERTLRVLARRGEMPALWAAVAWLRAKAGSEAPDDSTIAGLAARAVRSLWEVDALEGVAQALLDGPLASRDPAKSVLVAAGAAGAEALCRARSLGVGGEAARGRFVSAIKEIGPRALDAIFELLASVEAADTRDTGLAEDLLRAVPEVASEPLGDRIAPFASHPTPAVRKAALGALASTWLERARPRLLGALDDGDDGVRLAALASLRRTGGIDENLVFRVERMLKGGDSAGVEVCAAAVAALADLPIEHRAPALQVLSAAFETRPRGLLERFMGVRPSESPLVIETIARVLISLGGPAEADLVRRRADKGDAQTRERLMSLFRR